MNKKLQVYRAKIRKRMIELLKKSELFEAVYDSRISDYDPSVDPFPCSSVYANDDDNDVSYQRDSMNTLKESQVTLQIQIVNLITGDNSDAWPDAVEPIEAGVITYLSALDNERKIDDCIKWMTLSSSGSSVDLEGEVPVVSSTLNFMIQYNEELAFEASEDFDNIGYVLKDGDIAIAEGVIELNEVEIEEVDQTLRAPVYNPGPSISGTGIIGEPITAIDGTVEGYPIPDEVNEWYLDETATGDTSSEYIPQVADDGKEITRRNFASNGVLPDATAISNTISIVSGWVGIEDSYPGADIVYSNFIQRNDYVGNAQTVRVITTPSNIGFVNNKFDGDEWDTATTSGANVANGTDWYDQSLGGGFANQITASKQSPIDRNGAMISDFATTLGLMTDDVYTSNMNDKATVLFNYNSNNSNITGWLYAWGGTPFSCIITSNIMRFNVGSSGNIQFNVSSFADGNDHLVTLTADGTDVFIDVDNIQQATYTGGYTISVASTKFSINMSAASSGISVNNLKDFIFYNGISFTPTERADIFNIWTTQNV